MLVKKPRGLPSAVSSSRGGVGMRVASCQECQSWNYSADFGLLTPPGNWLLADLILARNVFTSASGEQLENW